MNPSVSSPGTSVVGIAGTIGKAPRRWGECGTAVEGTEECTATVPSARELLGDSSVIDTRQSSFETDSLGWGVRACCGHRPINRNFGITCTAESRWGRRRRGKHQEKAPGRDARRINVFGEAPFLQAEDRGGGVRQAQTEGNFAAVGMHTYIATIDELPAFQSLPPTFVQIRARRQLRISVAPQTACKCEEFPPPQCLIALVCSTLRFFSVEIREELEKQLGKQLGKPLAPFSCPFLSRYVLFFQDVCNSEPNSPPPPHVVTPA